MHNNDLKNRIMRRVYAIWFFKKATSFFAVKIYLFIAMLSAAVYRISFFDVAKNAFNSSNSFFTIPQFFLSNFLAVDWTHHILPFGVMSMTLILAWDLFRMRKKEPHLARAN